MAIALRYALSPIQKTGIFSTKKNEKSKKAKLFAR